jgi:xanthine dehydrogenase small subunit
MPAPIRFVLNGKLVEIRGIAPTTTLLQWLRYGCGLTGTKEGCAEGDCGACTVAVRCEGRNGDNWQPINACIQLVCMLHGQTIRTVEGISGPNGALHPVQSAMAHGHASQCGFCTPGFVMSLWCGYQNGDSTEPGVVCDQLAGNLCRCTGYGPILAAAEAARGQMPVQPAEEPKGLAKELSQIAREGLEYKGAGKHFWSPVRISELAELLRTHPDATVVAGATDVGLWVTKDDFAPDKVIHVGRIRELRDIDLSKTRLRIGAAVTLAEAAPHLGEMFPDMGELLRRFGGQQVRGSGTVGGNIANGSPIGDLAPALIAADATLILRDAKSSRAIPIADFFVDYGKQDLNSGEFVEAVEIPVPSDGWQLRCYKISKRFDQDISAVLACFDVETDGERVIAARLAFGGMAGIPMRAAKAEAALIGQPWTANSINIAADAFAQDFSPISDHRASASYRLTVARNLLLKYFIEMTEPATATRMVGRPQEVA